MQKVIAISSGHGKYVRGASGYLDEVDEARRVVAQVATELKQIGCTVHGPFNDDWSKSQEENLNRIVEWHNDLERDLDVSVHFNANVPTSNPMGDEVLFVSQGDLAAHVAEAISVAGNLKNRGGKKRTDLFFLNNTDRPAILIEVCFVDSLADADLYNGNFNTICKAIAWSISGRAVESPKPPSGERPEVARGDSGPHVVSIQQSLGLPSDGNFGSITEAGVMGFQRAWAVPGGADGTVGPNTWAALDDLDERVETGGEPITDELAAKIEDIVSKSPVLGYVWKERGKALQGYYVGMAKTFALALQRLENDDDAVSIMAQADTDEPDTDVLSWYSDKFIEQEMDNSEYGADTLRHLFVLMVGLGMRESSGDHWEGRDMTATNVESDTAEAGLFQASWNLSSSSDEIDVLLGEFKANPNGFRPDFTDELYPNTGNLDNYGSGDGCYYQWLAKYCPAFSVFMAGVGLRKRRQHWGPINRKEVELVSLVDDLLMDVERVTMEAERPLIV